MTTCEIRDLAIKLGAMETISLKPQKSTKPAVKQRYSYLIVLDFEATCWDTNVKKPKNEIIEFACVLLSIREKKIVSTFKKYAKPTESPILSAFCTSLTGIKQSTVNNASTINIVLENFDAWVKENSKLYDFGFPSVFLNKEEHMCTFATWSDWDLGTCLKKECKRKKLPREDYFDQWIDVRKTYVNLYKDKPMGLLGALHSLKMEFIGQEHCGIDDARNTAFLINQMIEDGVKLEISKSI